MAKKPVQPKAKIPKRNLPGGWVLFIIILFMLFFILVDFFPSSDLISWQELNRDLLDKKAVEKIIVVNKETAKIYLKPEFLHDSTSKMDFISPFGSRTDPQYQLNIGSVDSFERKLDQAQSNVPVSERVNVIYEDKSTIGELLVWFFPLLLFFFIIRFFLQRPMSGHGGTSALNFGRSTARLWENEENSKVSFDQVAGLVEAKEEVKEIVDFLKDPKRYTKLGAKIPKGVIIVGPPGTGKTLLAKAVAGEAQVPFFSLSGSEFVEMFVGVGASRVRDLFKRAKEKAPCIVFIDEIDAVGRSRGKEGLFTGASDERESTLNQLLTEMDGFGTNTGVIVLAATNRADILDPALLRPGRFDRHIYLELPNLAERKEIFEVHIAPLLLSEDLDLEVLASQTPGFSGADIANICNEAALIAARKNRERVGKQDFSDAMDRIIAGLEKKSKIISTEEKKIVAYHEAGHAIVSWLLPQIDPLMKVSIIPRGKSLGAAWYLPEEHQIMTFSQFSQRISASLAGRAAEEVIFGEVSTGAVDDLEKTTKEAYSMVAFLGFNKKVGNISFYDSTGKMAAGIQKPYSEETGKLIDEEVRKLVEDCYQQAKNILEQHKQELIELAELLLSKEVVFKEEIEEMLGKRSLNQPPKLPV